MNKFKSTHINKLNSSVSMNIIGNTDHKTNDKFRNIKTDVGIPRYEDKLYDKIMKNQTSFQLTNSLILKHKEMSNIENNKNELLTNNNELSNEITFSMSDVYNNILEIPMKENKESITQINPYYEKPKQELILKKSLWNDINISKKKW